MRRAAFAAPLLALLAAAPAAGAGPVRNAEAVHLTGGPNAGRVLLVVRARYKRGARTRRDRLHVRLRAGARTIASASFSFVVPHGRGGTLAIHHRRLLGPATSRRVRPTSALRLVTVAPGAAARAANSGTEVDQTTGPGTFLPAAQYCLQSCSTVLDTFLETGGSPWLGGLTSGAFNWVSVQWSPFSLTPLACSATS